MVRRALALATATALATAALVAGAPAASAATTCVTTTEPVINGTELCVAPGTVGVTWRYVPYSIGSICVDTACTEPQYGWISVPTGIQDPLDVYGTLCYTVKVQVCRTISDDTILNALQIGGL